MDFNVSKNTYLCQSFQLSITLESLSIQQILTENIAKSSFVFLKNSHKSKIPLYRLKNSSRVIYRCAIALSLAKNTNLPATEIAIALVNSLPRNSPIGSQSQLDFSIRVSNEGWIDFYLSDRSLCFWLQSLLQATASSLPKFPDPSLPPCSENVFPIQYAHARCCSLLRLAREEGSIEIEFNDSEKLFVVHPAEQNSIDRLLELADVKASDRPQDWYKLAARLTQTFLELHRQCPIWERTNPNFLRSAKVRLGLIQVTQYFLNWLLIEKIGVTAPQEL
ncbi:MAG: DALR anticodon-binding domain-containing protein [Prochloraceae cyanobacterium]|nr:DALR anticodon-binding domain-containing protein [Prochloraceae cyanobacterium]